MHANTQWFLFALSLLLISTLALAQTFQLVDMTSTGASGHDQENRKFYNQNGCQFGTFYSIRSDFAEHQENLLQFGGQQNVSSSGLRTSRFSSNSPCLAYNSCS